MNNYRDGVSDTLITALVLLALVVGLAGTVVPVLPGILLMWGAVVAYGFLVGFGPVGVGAVVFITLLSALAVVLGFVLPKRFADDSGASLLSQLAAVVGGIVGFFVIPVVGIVFGALFGIALAEYLDKGDWARAWKSTIAVAKGFGVSALAQIAIGFVILVAWSGWAATVVF